MGMRAVLLFLYANVGRMEVVEDAHCFGEQRVVAPRPFLGSPEHRLQSPSIGYRDAADVEEVNRRADGP
jgi:hypothetical protein